MSSGPFSRAGVAYAENSGVGEVLRFRRPPFSERVRLLLRRSFAVAGEGFPELTFADYQRLGRQVRREARLPACVDPRWYCLELKVSFVAEPDTRGCGGELFVPRPFPLILYRPSIDPAAIGFSISHGLAHYCVERKFGELPHVDVILSSLEIMCPSDELLDDGPERFKARQRFAPGWVVDEYWKALDAGWLR